ncbi:MAG: hypothetical protein IJW64_04355 [Clostridia bacterium]|nr:hypothetical protein [Clostridia bacterium]
MKNFNKLIAILLLVVTASCLFGCKKQVQTFENSIVITADSKFMDIKDDTVLLDYMNELKSDGQIDFVISNGMITEMNGVKNTDNSYWMLYTDDAELSNKAWGEVVVDEKTYSSAVLGAESLVIKDGKTYVWSYVTFQ